VRRRRGVRRDGDGVRRRRRRRHGPGPGAGAGRRGRVEDRRRRRGRGRPARAGAVEQPQAVPGVARQLAGERRAGEPAPRVRAQDVQQRLDLGGGPGALAGLGVASFPVAAPRDGLLLPLTNVFLETDYCESYLPPLIDQ
jgi:hypothetical protein